MLVLYAGGFGLAIALESAAPIALAWCTGLYLVRTYGVVYRGSELVQRDLDPDGYRAGIAAHTWFAGFWVLLALAQALVAVLKVVERYRALG